MKPTITIPLDPDTARAYESAPPEEQKKIRALLTLWVRELTASEFATLEEVLATVGQKVRAQGLTPETLESILKDA